jgi:SAM-dependent methyltransferase
MQNQFHRANRYRWDAGAESWARRADSRGIWRNCHRDPSLALVPAELKWLSEIAGKEVAVLGSGDNQVAFALSGMSAKVTSVDISDQQLKVARERAAELGLDIRFLRADVTDLSVLSSYRFDLVYTGGHVAVWVSDLQRFYCEAARILRPDGLLIISEYHPFRRIWKESRDHLEVARSYFDRGPHQYHVSADLFDTEPGDLMQFEFHWTVADYISAVLATDCKLLHVEEFGEGVEGWENVPLTGIPATLLLVARRGLRHGSESLP